MKTPKRRGEGRELDGAAGMRSVQPRSGDLDRGVSRHDRQKGSVMGEAKRRGTFEERKAMAVAKAEERERLWNEKQRQRREERLKSEAIRPKESPKRMNTRLLVAAAMAMASAGMVTGK